MVQIYLKAHNSNINLALFIVAKLPFRPIFHKNNLLSVSSTPTALDRVKRRKIIIPAVVENMFVGLNREVLIESI